MERIIIEKIQRITKNRKKLEKTLNVKIENRGKEVFVTGEAEDEYIAEKVIEALEIGFPFSTALLLKEEDYMLEIINIKNHTTRKDLERIRARIIGRNGKTLKTLSDLTGCYFEIKENQVGIIGDAEFIKNAQDALISIIKGSKQSNVYSNLEKQRVQPIEDLGLKEAKK
ncbi:MAG: hypothetical protein KKC19_01660 [Nanoarchaeota archaeon]|nr:hypothetical protein [Nanoarchaeota archaeon]